MIRNGQVITFAVRGTTGAYLPRSVAAVRQVVLDSLTPFFVVEDLTFKTDSVLSDPFHALSAWPYSASVRAKMQSDYADVLDVDSIVAHAFYNGAGELPTVTANGYERGQGADTQTGFSLTQALVLVAVALVAYAAIKVAPVARGLTA